MVINGFQHQGFADCEFVNYNSKQRGITVILHLFYCCLRPLQRLLVFPHRKQQITETKTLQRIEPGIFRPSLFLHRLCFNKQFFRRFVFSGLV